MNPTFRALTHEEEDRWIQLWGSVQSACLDQCFMLNEQIYVLCTNGGDYNIYDGSSRYPLNHGYSGLEGFPPELIEPAVLWLETRYAGLTFYEFAAAMLA